MKFYTITFVAILILLCSHEAIGQQESKQSTDDQKESKALKDKLVFGGNLGLNFGTTTFIELSPTVGYKLKPNLITGVGFNFNYFSNRTFKGTLYGPSVFARYNVLQGFFLHSEFQQTYTSFEQRGFEGSQKNDFPMMLVGGGAYTSLGGNSQIGISVLYDILENSNNFFYSNPLIRGGVMVGF